MKIKEISAVGLGGATPEGGWSEELETDDCVHTLITIITDEGLTGLGSVFTNDGLVKAALNVLKPLYLGENALEPERVSETLRQNMFWLGRGGSVTHTISTYRHRTLGSTGEGHWPTGWAFIGWTLQGAGETLCITPDGGA